MLGVNIMNHIQKQCVTSVSLQMSLLKDKNIDMLITFSLWTLDKFKILLNIGFKKSIQLNKELDIYMDTMPKIHIIKAVLESLSKQFMSLNKLEHTAISKLKTTLQNLIGPILSQMGFLLKELDGFILKLIMIQLWTKRNWEWQLKCNNNIELLIHRDTKFLTL
jgi:hypothetical protein